MDLAQEMCVQGPCGWTPRSEARLAPPSLSAGAVEGRAGFLPCGAWNKMAGEAGDWSRRNVVLSQSRAEAALPSGVGCQLVNAV